MVGQIIAIASVAVATAISEKVCNVMGRPDIGEYTKVAGVGLTGGLAVSIIISLLNQVKSAFAD